MEIMSSQYHGLDLVVIVIVLLDRLVKVLLLLAYHFKRLIRHLYELVVVLIAIVLADARLRAAERDAAPLLLLDEVAAHLDRDRREALFDEIYGLNAQVWLTGTDVATFDGMRDRAQFLDVQDGCSRLIS